MKRVFTLWTLLFCLALFITPTTKSIYAQEDAAEPENIYQEQAQFLLSRMSPAERVGQLFMVTFEGSQVAEEDTISQLITEHHIGGVVLSRGHDNFSDLENLETQVYQLTTNLQELATLGQIQTQSLNLPDTDELDRQATPEATVTPQPIHSGIPLFIASYGIENGTQTILDESLAVPNLMALGATWNPQQAELSGQLHGEQFHQLGINMLLGPTLDVLSTPQIASGNRPLTQFFGGNPYWVGQMGQAYIRGVHTGSNGGVATIASLFPGSGHSDRSTHEEIATIRKSIEQLQANELVPFTAVTNSNLVTNTVSGLMSGHLRYQGLQGNIGTNTPPFSFDPQAINTLLQLPEFTTWRSQGGLIMSDALGVPALATFYDSTRQSFPHRQIAKDALLAGNDLLFVANFTTDGVSSEDHLANVRDTLTWFEGRYQTDPAFQARVDEAVLRILQAKFQVYDGNIRVDNVLTDANQGPPALDLPQSDSILFGVAQAAVSLLSPAPEELQDRLPNPPTVGENIVIFTEDITQQQCSTCTPRPLIDQDAIGDEMINLYGPAGSGQIEASQIQSFSFSELTTYLEAPRPIVISQTLSDTIGTDSENNTQNITPTPSPPTEAVAIQQALDEADWIVVALISDRSQILHQLLNEAQLWQGRKLIVYAFGAPTHLDSTEVSKLTAYFGVYQPHRSFIDASVRTLFRDLTIKGASPISLESLGYDLREVTQPDPNQVIELAISENTAEPETEQENTADGESATLSLTPGDSLQLQTGVIMDNNGHTVPDGTQVQFIQEDRVQGFFDVIGEVFTINGIARFDYILEDRPGQFRLRAVAGPATNSEQVDIAITESEEASILIITPTPEPVTPTATPTQEPTNTPQPTDTVTPIPTVIPSNEPDVGQPQLLLTLTDFWEIISLVGGLLLIAFFGNRLPLRPSKRLHVITWGWMIGILFYTYHILELPGAEQLPNWGYAISFLAALTGGWVGVFSSWLWSTVQQRQEAELA